jgi:hypothetical protein
MFAGAANSPAPTAKPAGPAWPHYDNVLIAGGGSGHGFKHREPARRRPTQPRAQRQRHRRLARLGAARNSRHAGGGRASPGAGSRHAPEHPQQPTAAPTIRTVKLRSRC